MMTINRDKNCTTLLELCNAEQGTFIVSINRVALDENTFTGVVLVCASYHLYLLTDFEVE